MMLNRRSTIHLLILIALTMAVMCVDAQAAGSRGINLDSSPYKTGNPFYDSGWRGQCTWYAWGRAKQLFYVDIPCRGNAGTWDETASRNGWSVGTTPKKYSIAVWEASTIGNQYGHVAFVEEVTSSEIYVSEANFNNANINVDYRYSEGVFNRSTRQYHGTYNESTNYSRKFPDHYIYIDKEPLPTKNVLSGVYIIHSAWDDRYCLDIEKDSKDNDANIQLYHRVYNDVQKFRIIKWDNDYYCIQSIYNGRWLDVKTPVEERSNVKLYYDNDADEDYWCFEDAGNGYVYIRNKTGYYLDVQPDEAVDNANIQIYSFNATNSQKWRLEEVTDYCTLEDGVYTVSTARNTDYRLDISGNSTENRANIQLYVKENSPVQLFEFRKKGSYYVVRSLHADKWLDIKLNSSGVVENKANVQLWESNGSDEEHWVLENAGDGYVYMRSNADFYMDVEYDQAVNNANIQVYRFTGNNSQRWLLTRADYKVSYDLNGGSGTIPTQIKYDGIDILLNSAKPIKAGYEFVTWNTRIDGKGTSYAPGVVFSQNENTVLYAVWKRYPDLPAREVDEDIYRIHSALDDDYCLDITGNSADNNANVQLYHWENTDVQQFRFVKGVEGYYYIQSVFSEKWLDVKTPIGDHSNVKLYDTNTDDEDCWMFEDAGDGYVFIRNKTGYYLDVQGDRAEDNANVQIYHFIGETNRSQKWRLEKVVEMEPDFILPQSLVAIEDEAFVGGAFTCVRVGENVNSIGSRAFANCRNLRHIFIPASAASIAPDAFDGVPEGLVIHGTTGSYGEDYANNNGLTFMRE